MNRGVDNESKGEREEGGRVGVVWGRKVPCELFRNTGTGFSLGQHTVEVLFLQIQMEKTVMTSKPKITMEQKYTHTQVFYPTIFRSLENMICFLNLFTCHNYIHVCLYIYGFFLLQLQNYNNSCEKGLDRKICNNFHILLINKNNN